jgi:hypothetical protein
VLEIGAGDGTLLLRLARALSPRWAAVEVTLLDQQDLLSAGTRRSYAELGWQVITQRTEIMAWALQPPAQHFDLGLANLFLHHFDNAVLARLLQAMAARVDAFVACEPRRNAASRWGSALVGLLGTNAVTRADAVTSVAAGFAQSELTALWQAGPGDWVTNESRGLPFSHCFTAVRGSARRSGAL